MLASFKFPSLETSLEEFKSQITTIENNPQNKIQVSDTLHGSHPIITDWIKKWGQKHFQINAKRRKLLIFNALFKALEKRGLQIEGNYFEKNMIVRFQSDKVEFRIKERYFNKKIPALQSEKLFYPKGYKTEPVMTGELVLYLEPNPQKYDPIKIKDEKDNPLENQLNEVIIALYVSLLHSHRKRLESEKHAQEYRAAESRRYAEKRRCETLEEDVGKFQRAEAIRNYVEHADKSQYKLHMTPEEFENWKIWASNYADKLDPLMALPQISHEEFMRRIKANSNEN